MTETDKQDKIDPIVNDQPLTQDKADPKDNDHPATVAALFRMLLQQPGVWGVLLFGVLIGFFLGTFLVLENADSVAKALISSMTARM